MKYKIKLRKRFFWKTYNVIGHKLLPELNRLDLFFEDGSIYSVGNWDKYDLKLGTDWVLATKKRMEEQTGQDIKLKVG